MPFAHRSALPALCLSLILPCALAAETATPAPDAAPASEASPPARLPLLERSEEDALALERTVPQQEQQSLQADGETFLALWKPANTSEPSGAVIIIPGAGETADWPQVIGPLRQKLPDAQWHSLSISLPDLQSEAAQPRKIATEPPATEPPAVDSSSKEAASAATQPIEQAASAETTNEAAERAAANHEDPLKADAERIFARLDAAIAYAQQQNARGIVLLGHGTGAYWGARYISERQPPQIQKLVLVSAQIPTEAKPDLTQLLPTLKLAVADFFYNDKPLPRQSAAQRLQTSKRDKGSNFTQIALSALPGNSAAQQEQLFRRVRGWLSPQPVDKP